MKNKSLFYLIKSLSKAEKRHFKQHANTYGKSKSLIALFDAINTQNDYDEKKLKNIHGFKNLAVSKSHLYYKILESLNSIKPDKNSKNATQNEKHIEILLSKSLYEDAKYFLRQNEKMAKEQEDFLLSYKTLESKRRIESHKSLEDKEKYLKQVFKEEKLLLQKQLEYTEFIDLWNQFSIQEHKNFNPRSHSDLKVINDILKNRLLQTSYKPLSKRAYNYQQHILMDCYKYIQDIEKAFGILEKLIYESEKDKLFENNPLNYISRLYNFLNLALRAKKINIFIEYINHFNLVKLETNEIEKRIFERKTLLYSSYFIITLKLEEGIQFYVKQKPNIELNWNVMSKRHLAESLFHFGLCYFYSEKFVKAQELFVDIENMEKFKAFTDLIILSRILILFCRLELQQTTYLNNYAKNLRSFIQQKEAHNKFELIVLKYLNNLLKLNYSADIKTTYANLYKELKELEKDRFENTILETIDLLAYTKSRVQRKTYLQIKKAQTE